MRVGNLSRIFGDFDFRNDAAVFVFFCNELVNTAENRVTLCRNQTLTDTKRVDLRALVDQIADDIFVKRVGNNDLTFRQSRFIEHLTRFFGKVRQVAGVETNAALGDALRNENFLERTNGIRNTRTQNIVGIDKQCRVVRIQFAVGTEGIVFGFKHLHPRMCHRTGRRDFIHAVGKRTCRCMTAADVRRSCAENRTVSALCTAGTELCNRTSLCRTNHTACLCRNQRLVIERKQKECFNKLCLHRTCSYRQNRLTREDRGSLGNSPDVAGKAEGAQIVEESFGKLLLGTQKVQIFLGKMQIGNIIDDLLQSCGNCITAAVGYSAEEHIEIGNFIAFSGEEVAVCHRQFVKITK